MDILLAVLDLSGLLLTGFLFWLLTDWEPWRPRAKRARSLRQHRAPELATTLERRNAYSRRRSMMAVVVRKMAAMGIATIGGWSEATFALLLRAARTLGSGGLALLAYLLRSCRALAQRPHLGFVESHPSRDYCEGRELDEPDAALVSSSAVGRMLSLEILSLEEAAAALRRIERGAVRSRLG